MNEFVMFKSLYNIGIFIVTQPKSLWMHMHYAYPYKLGSSGASSQPQPIINLIVICI